MGEKSVDLVQERGVGGGGVIVALFVVSDVLDALLHGAGVVFPKVGCYLLFAFCFISLDASVQDCSGLPVGLPVS